MSLPSASTIMKLFLFGTTEPVDYVSEERIRPNNVTTPWSVDMNEYMNSIGRFATLGKFKVVQEFFNQLNAASNNLALGISLEGRVAANDVDWRMVA